MLALINRLLDWFRSLFWKEEMELTLVGLQYSGKTTFVNVIAVSSCQNKRCQCGPRLLPGTTLTNAQNLSDSELLLRKAEDTAAGLDSV